MTDPWVALSQVLLLIAAAAAFGALAERLRQNAIVGYLAAGMLIGPNVLHLVRSPEVVQGIAELGVALLLFSIGLEFSPRRVRSLGRFPLVSGALQVLLTWGLVAVLWSLAHPGREAIAVGAVVAMSSTACVLRVLTDRAEVDSVVGRTALGILLMQDMAAIPLVLILTLVGRREGVLASLGEFVLVLAQAVLLLGVFWLVFTRLAPRLLLTRGVGRNRELLVLLAALCAGGSAWAAHALHLSPALGAFVAGMLLAESRFAAQIDADVGPLRTIFVTLFFGATGMLADPVWIADHWGRVLMAVAAVLVLKTGVVYALARAFGQARPDALGTGMSLAQVGEFGLVLATVARGAGLLDVDAFALVASVIGATLFLTPYLVIGATPLAARLFREAARAATPDTGSATGEERHQRTIVVGFGPAGRRVVDAFRDLPDRVPVTVVDLNPAGTTEATALDARFVLGDARQIGILVHAGARDAGVIVVTLPDTKAASQVIANARALAPRATIVVRARYHAMQWQLQREGADITVDEEYEVGRHLADATLRVLRARASTDRVAREDARVPAPGSTDTP